MYAYARNSEDNSIKSELFDRACRRIGFSLRITIETFQWINVPDEEGPSATSFAFPESGAVERR